jgi:dTDP-4-dehydrorhamnose reductase
VNHRTVLLTGASGLLGTWLRRTVPNATTLLLLTHRARVAGDDGLVADLRERDAVAAVVAHAQPGLVLHAAYAPDEASIVTATENVVAAAREVGAELLFVSSDAVFSGDGSPRGEDDAPDPVWDYGRWKARAEDAVRELRAATIVRLPLVVSLDPEDHVVVQIRAGIAAGRPTTWFTDEYRQPAHAEELARALWSIAALDAGARSGTWHLAGPERLTRFAIAQRVVSALGLGDEAIAAAPTPVSAVRPRDLNLLDERARSAIGWNPSPILPS